MSRPVTIVDYGIGNLNSIARAITKAGGSASITDSPNYISKAEMLLLPGVGAFGPCAAKLSEGGFVDPIKEFARTGRPFLGICVGMQLLFEHSLEFGKHPGLAILKGHVEEIPAQSENGLTRKIPHIGWSPLLLPAERESWQGTSLQNAKPGVTATYFVHSFSCMPQNPDDRLADVNHQGYNICAAVQRDNITGFQSHPEKSGKAGLSILADFLNA